jgi:hypothetical protein
MNELITKGAKYVEVIRDEDPESPREWSNLGTMVCFHRRYNLGDKHDYKVDDYNSWDEVKAALIEKGAKYIAPLYLYDHGGISISIGSFIGKAPHAEWDSGQVGLIYTTEESIAEFGIEADKVESALEHEVDTYNQYLMGEVYGYRIMERNTCGTCSHIDIQEIDSGYSYYSEEAAREAGEAEL